MQGYSLYSTEHENTCIGQSPLAVPPMREFCIGEISMLVSKSAKICVIRLGLTPNKGPAREDRTVHVTGTLNGS